MKTRVRVVHEQDPSLELDTDNLHWLTDDEVSRHQSISSAQRKRQFLAGHFLARKMAAHLYGNSIEDWVYGVDDSNQRFLKCRTPGVLPLYVSLSHSGGWIAAAISDSAIGIDIETYGKQRDFIAIASHVFSEAETNLLKSLPPDQLNRQFYLYWTLKESVAKQFGDGLKFEVSRAHSLFHAVSREVASIFSWQCPEFVLAMAGKPSLDIEILGLCEPVEQHCWNSLPIN